MKNILEKDSSKNEDIRLDEWKMKVHAIYIDDPQKSQNVVIKHFGRLSEQDYKNISEMNKRLFEIFEHATKINVFIFFSIFL